MDKPQQKGAPYKRTDELNIKCVNSKKTKDPNPSKKQIKKEKQSDLRISPSLGLDHDYMTKTQPATGNLSALEQSPRAKNSETQRMPELAESKPQKQSKANNATAAKRAKASENKTQLLKNSSSFHLPKASGPTDRTPI